MSCRLQSPFLRLLAFLVFTVGATPSGRAQGEAEPAVPERIDLTNFPGELVDKVVVPIPAEIFAVLDKLDEPDWNSGIELPAEGEQGRDRAILALIFGSLVGEGFIAVQAKNSDEIQKIGRRVLAISESLGLAGAVRPHSLAIIESAGKNDWSKVRDELDATQQTVRTTMESLRDDELSGLVSLGGWLRGTNVVTTFISNSFSEDKAELLNQPGLVAHFRTMLGSMKGSSGKSPQIRAISTGLARLEAIITQSEAIAEEDVNQLRDISRAMLDEYYFIKP
ncbi:MAG: hypothetical protein NWR21_07720 [Verrucomicrobiales bacterium]|jgi:hypothetical protein|nr:hypothetical protein [Verrucomicrobiales bacterium]MDP4790311.1 hypothetical protein [Verrucomicrobiales bacterium]MDP4939185.1 hypothetical protein [Verrucomicrobiales bacterium]MDP5006436.1 hypothetical protein [Verrucomicrobiales bacterium]